MVNMHIGSSSKMPSTSARRARGRRLDRSASHNAMASLVDWLFSGVFDPLPQPELAYREGQIGWIPYILERADTVWEEHRAWGGVGDTFPSRRRRTTTGRSSAASSTTPTACESVDEVGVDNISFETDYPHTDSTWPHTNEIAERRWPTWTTRPLQGPPGQRHQDVDLDHLSS